MAVIKENGRLFGAQDEGVFMGDSSFVRGLLQLGHSVR